MSNKKTVDHIRLVLGDQLNILHSWFSRVDDSVLYIMAEQRSETDYTLHHAQKLIGVISAMRAFASRLEQLGHRVHYVRLGDSNNRHNFSHNISDLIQLYRPLSFSWQQPDEYRLEHELEKFAASLAQESGMLTRKVSTEHFISSPEEFDPLMKDSKIPTMERFYRHMRKQTGYLMTDNAPMGGKWNYDSENRSPIKDRPSIPPWPYPIRSEKNLWNDIRDAGVESFGTPHAKDFPWPENREQALAGLNKFLSKRLVNFGTYQDAMVDGEPYLYHSLISFALNIKLISPKEVIESALAKWQDAAGRDKRILASLEGFIRQILGWREYMRHVYRVSMPEYARLNYFDAHRSLPSWYWTGKTRMNCLVGAVSQSLENAYAHHIQRLMITGNFAMLAGIDPDEVDRWYLGIYIDAFEWVEITNTRGMSQYADGGMVATKPYAASASYINKMSDYCKGCAYNKKLRHGENACPFNALYWHFLHRNRNILKTNHRLAMPYRVWDRFERDEQDAILQYADICINGIEEL